MRKTAVYARVSTEHEAQIAALANQVKFYDDVLSRFDDLELYERYIDEGITGTSTKKRKNFNRMIEDAKAGYFNLIITREVSRFARNIVDTLEITRELKRIGVEVYFVNEGIWTIKDSDAETKLAMLALFAQNESKSTSSRVKAGQMMSFKKGVVYGTGNILGYDRLGKEMVINEEQAKTVRFIFDLCLKGYGSRKIQYELEKGGYTTSSGLTKWSPATIIRILKNPFYCGTVVYRKSFIPDFLEQKPKKNRGEVEQVIVEGKHESIVTKQEFDKVQMILNSHRTNNKDEATLRGKLPTTVYGKKIVCSCGSSMNKKTYHKYADGHRSWCYQCYSQTNSGSYTSRLKNGVSTDGICDVKMIPEWKLKIISYIVFDKIWNEKEQILDIIDHLLEQIITDDDTDDEIKRLEKRVELLNKKLSKLLDTYLSDMLTKDEYSNKKQELDNEICSLSTRLNNMKSNAQPVKTAKERLKECKEIIRNKLDYKRGELSDEFVDSFVNKIVVSNDHIEWYLNFANEIDNSTNMTYNEIAEGGNIFLGRIVITKDDAVSYSKYCDELSRVCLKETIDVDVYI